MIFNNIMKMNILFIAISHVSYRICHENYAIYRVAHIIVSIPNYNYNKYIYIR